MNLYRGKNYGVFAGSDGYVGQMAPDGVSHYQDRGSGWSQIVLKEKNRIARAWDTGESYDDLTQQGGTEWKIGHRQ